MISDELKPLEIHIHPVEEMERLRKEMKKNNVTVIDVPGCIIDSPLNKMSIKLIDLNVESLADTLIAASKTKSGERSPVCATVRGMGGGKTRAFEETRRLLLMREGESVRSTFILSIES